MLPKEFEASAPAWLATRSLSAEELRSKSEDELLDFLHGQGRPGGIALPMQNAILAELIRRSSKPHWTTVPSYWFLIASLGVAVAGLLVAVAALLVQLSAPSAPAPAASATTSAPASRPASRG